MTTLVTLEEVASMFRVSVPTFRSWIKLYPERVPPYINVGTEQRPIRRWAKDDVERYIKDLFRNGSTMMPQSLDTEVVDIPD